MSGCVRNHNEISYLLTDLRVESDHRRDADLGVSGAVIGVWEREGTPVEHAGGSAT
jgi:hypothetical protein